MVLITFITEPVEGLIYANNNIQFKIGEKVIGAGTLYISSESLGWQPNNLDEGISILWKQIGVHGISTNPTKCIYFMLDQKLLWPSVYEGAIANGGDKIAYGGDVAAPIDHEMIEDNVEEDEGNATDEEYDDVVDHMTECWLIPEDINSVDTMFQAMADCQALHPDSADSISEEIDFMDDNENIGLEHADDSDNDGADGAQGGLENLNLNDERFADAEE